MAKFKHTFIQHEGSSSPPLSVHGLLPRKHNSIWRREAWRYFEVQDGHGRVNTNPEQRLLISKRQFSNLEPALELATIMLDRAKPLLNQIFYAPVVYDHKTGLDRLKTLWKADPKQDVVRDVLPLLQDHYRFACLPYAPPTEPNHLCNTGAVIDNNGEYVTFKIYTNFAQEFLAVIIGDALSKAPRAHEEAVQVMLAVALVAELAHALWSFRNLCSQPSVTNGKAYQIPREPIVFMTDYAGLGASVSQFLFGLEISLPRGYVFFPHDESNDKPLPEPRYLSRERLYVDGSNGLQAWTRNRDGTICREFKLSKRTIRDFFNLYMWVKAPGQDIEQPTLQLCLIPNEVELDETLPSSDDEIGAKHSRTASTKQSKKQNSLRKSRLQRKSGTSDLR